MSTPLSEPLLADMTPQDPAAPPSRFSATPAQVDTYLRTILAEDTYLRYQQTIGGLAVEEAARDQRMHAADMQLHKPMVADVVRDTADLVDPLKGGGPYPSQLQCSQHGGFGPCPGWPKCTGGKTPEGGAPDA